MLIHLAAMMAHGFFGLALMQTTTVIAPDWYTSVHPSWASSLLNDQKLGAGIAWAFGEIPAAVVMILLVRQWIDADQREQRRIDRAADRAEATGEDDDLARYNAFLASSARHDGRGRSPSRLPTRASPIGGHQRPVIAGGECAVVNDSFARGTSNARPCQRRETACTSARLVSVQTI
ncbi:cytochrome c oxidase assembly protein [Micromonospora sp. HUAS YX12]|uniref:Cytochrome c oxidase assembly protein n=1 Tax=Micromonospora sp. HUAS YX12 TaxID=3156396 RepID=A0AAU7QVR3_9ACTN